MRKYKYQEGGEVRSAIGNEPVGERLRRAFRQGPSQRPAREPSGTPAGQRPTEDRARMAAEAAAEFDREEADLAARAAARRQERANRPSRITNDPVGSRLAGRASPPPAAPAREPRMNLDPGDVMEYRTDRTGPPGAARMREVDMQGGDVPGNRSMSPPGRPRPRPAPRPVREAGTGEGGTPQSESTQRLQPEERSFLERLFRRTNETGMDPATMEMRRNYLGSGAADTNVSYNKKGGLLKAKAPVKKQAYKKGGMVKPKGHGMKEEAMEMKGGRYRGGMKEEMAEMGPMRKKGPMPMMKKGGAVKAPAKKMKTGGKVPAPKKMMKGGMTSKPKKMMGGGRAMYAKGGMTRGCK